MATYRETILATSGLISYWPLDELAGSTATDANGAHNGTNTGATVGSTGLVTNTGKTSYLYDADGDRVLIANHADFDTNNMSMEAWFIITSWGERRIVSHRVTTTGTLGWEFHSHGADTGKMLFDLDIVSDGFVRAATTGWDVNTVWHVVVTYNGRLRTYRNGQLIDTSAFNSANAITKPANTVTGIGYNPESGDSTRGRISDVSIYNVAIDDATVLAHYNAGIAAAPSGASLINTQFQLRPY